MGLIKFLFGLFLLAQNIPQTICHECGEIFLGPDSLEVIRSQEIRSKRPRRRRKTAKSMHV